MESEIITAYNAYWQKFAEFVQMVRSQVKAKSSINEACAHLGITRNMFDQRLRYPQNWDVEEVTRLAEFLADDAMTKALSEAYTLGQVLVDTITSCMKDANITVTFLCKKLNTDTSNFYRKQKDPRLWNKPEIDKITQVVETMKSL